MKFDQTETGFRKQKNKRNKRSESISDNRTKFEVEEEEGCTKIMDSHDQFFRKVAVGRAYQVMIIMGALRCKPLERLETKSLMQNMETEGSDEEDEDHDTIPDGALNTYTRIGRFFDTISKEAAMIRDNVENILFGEIARTTRIEREAAEANRRHVEIRARYEQDELLKQVMKIHQNISELVNDRLTDDVIDEYANDVAVELIKNVISSNPDKIGREDVCIEQELQDFLVHFANTR